MSSSPLIFYFLRFFQPLFYDLFIDHFMWVALIPQVVRLRVIAQSLVQFDFQFWFPILRLLVRCSEFVKWINGGVSQLRNRQATVNTLSPVHIKSVCLNIFMLWMKYDCIECNSGTKDSWTQAHYTSNTSTFLQGLQVLVV